MTEASRQLRLKFVDDFLGIAKEVENAEADYVNYSVTLMKAKHDLLAQEDQLLLKGMDGPINGKNERIREAQMRELLEPAMSLVMSLQIEVIVSEAALRILRAKQSAMEHAALLLSEMD